MNRSAIDAEVEYHLRMQEWAHLEGVEAEPGMRRPGLASRLWAWLRKRRALAGKGQAAPRPDVRPGTADEGEPRLGWR